MIKDSFLDKTLSRWNGVWGKTLFLSKEVLDLTFFAVPQDRRLVLEDEDLALFIKRDHDLLRLHLAVIDEARQQALVRAIELLEKKKAQWGARQIVFGGGDRHLFPGIPLDQGRSWLAHFSPSGPEVADFEGELTGLGKLDETARGDLRSPQSTEERKNLVSFVENEFPGRWLREILVDLEGGFGEHYFGYYVEGALVGYVRLYGWRKDYWAPGVYFSGPGRGMGGLGPVGISQTQRGKGLGRDLLNQSWKILKTHKCRSVRVDWTTETTFYENAGLHKVQKYQPAFR